MKRISGFIFLLIFSVTFPRFPAHGAFGGGGCATLSINITAETVTVGSAITTVTPTLSSGTATDWSISPSVPSGITFDTSTGQVSGAPSNAQATQTYTITATLAAPCAPRTKDYALTVDPAPAPPAVPQPPIPTFFFAYSTCNRDVGIYLTPPTLEGTQNYVLLDSTYTHFTVVVADLKPEEALKKAIQDQCKPKESAIDTGTSTDIVPIETDTVIIDSDTKTIIPAPEPEPNLIKVANYQIGFVFAKSELLPYAGLFLSHLDLQKATYVELVGYAQENHWTGDYALSVHRAESVYKVLHARYPTLNIVFKGLGTNQNTMCAKWINKCTTIKVKY